MATEQNKGPGPLPDSGVIHEFAGHRLPIDFETVRASARGIAERVESEDFHDRGRLLIELAFHQAVTWVGLNSNEQLFAISWITMVATQILERKGVKV